MKKNEEKWMTHYTVFTLIYVISYDYMIPPRIPHDRHRTYFVPLFLSLNFISNVVA